MSRVFITGDTHGSMDIHKLSAQFFPVGRELTKKDYVIICGDFGLVFFNEQTNEEKYWLKWLTGRPWTTLFVDGNHENHPKLYNLQTANMFGSDVGEVTPSVFHLRRGKVYNINGNNFLAYGGAMSVDRETRVDGVSWWKDEIPRQEEFHLALENSQKHDIDYVIAHTLPRGIQYGLGYARYEDPTSKQLDHITCHLDFKKYFCGHFHDDRTFGKYNIMYNKVVEL
jgi:hypothetical protein